MAPPTERDMTQAPSQSASIKPAPLLPVDEALRLILNSATPLGIEVNFITLCSELSHKI
jgi:hypothetical protein